jgi:protein-S-isoprenylcysteine O-methyltransferase Ste14
LTLRYLVFGRVVPGTLYVLLGWVVVRQLIGSYQSLPSNLTVFQVAAGPVRETLYVAFVCMPVGIYLTRPMPRASNAGLWAWGAAMLGTFMLLFTGAYAPTGPQLWDAPNWVVDACDVVLALASALGVWGLATLRHSFSLIPEARRVVRSGPYRFVRHPLYLGEIAVAAALLVSGGTPPYGPHLVATVSVLLFIPVQLVRIRFEEALLTGAFPEYEEYARHTKRLIPFIW